MARRTRVSRAESSVYIWAWRPSFSCDQHHVHAFSFPCTWKLTYKIWLKLPSSFLGKQVLIFICKYTGAKVKKCHWPSIPSCLHLPTFRSQSAIVSEISTVFTFLYRKAWVTKFDLAVNRSRSTQGHHLNKIWWAGVPNATNQVSCKSVHQFWRSRL